MSEPVVVLGGSPDGLRAAAALAARGHTVTLVCPGSSVSGVTYEDLPIDTGAAFVTNYLAELTREVMGAMSPVAGVEAPQSAVLARGRAAELPLSRADVARLFDAGVALPAALAWTELRFRHRFGEYLGGWSELRTYQDWVRFHFGEPVLQHVYGPYCKKRWGSPEEVGAAVARQHHGVYEDGSMLAPSAGPAAAIAAQLERLQGGAHQILLEQEVQSLRVEDGRVVAVETQDGAIDVAGPLFSGHPPARMLDWLTDALPVEEVGESRHLRCRHGVQVLLPVEKEPPFFETHIVEPNVSAWRMIRPSDLPGCSALAGHVMLHLTVDASDPFWEVSDREVGERLGAQLGRTGYVAVRKGEVRVNRLADHHPLWAHTFHPQWSRAMVAMNTLGVRLIGRAGAFAQFDLHGEMQLLEGLLDQELVDQHELHRMFVDPPVGNDARLSLRRFITN